MIPLIAALFGCAYRAPPPTFHRPPPIDPPSFADLGEPAQDEVPTVAPYLPGEPPPYVVDGLVTARGILVPETRALELYRAAELGAWASARLELERDHRLADRAYCDDAIGTARRAARAAQLEASLLRWGLPGGLALGVALGVSAVEVGDRVGGGGK